MTLVPRNRRSPRTPDATLIYAVGDIHGRLDLLDGALRELAASASAAARDGAKVIAVFLGDYIDRGPESRGVIDRLMELRASAFCETIFLRGNHEQVLLDLLDGQETTGRWLEYGGRETLAAYGVEAPARDVPTLRSQAQAAVPPEHVAFLRETGLHAALGDYLFVHAGLRPDRLLEEQTDADLLWFRYYDDEAPVWDHTVVHGHSTNARPVVGRWRIGIDTEAYASGALTALRLQGERQDLLKISMPAGGGPATASPWNGADVSYQRGPRPAPDRARRPVAAPTKAAAKRPKPVKTTKPARRSMMVLVIPLGLIGMTAATVFAIAGPDGVAPPPSTTPTPSSLLRIEGAADAQASPKPDAKLAIAPAGEGLRGQLGIAARAPVAPSAPAASAEPSPAVRVQIAAVPNAENADRVWKELVDALPEPMDGKSMQVEQVQVGGQTHHRVLVAGFADAKAANGFCRTLQGAGRNCLVRKPPASETARAAPADRRVATRTKTPAEDS